MLPQNLDCDIHRINLSLTTVCSADCIFCPEVRGADGAKKHMTSALVEKLLIDMSKDPRLDHIKDFSCGENGDCFINPQAIDCLRMIRKYRPQSNIIIFTNFLTMKQSIAETLVKEQLVDRLECNIDGYDEEHYRAVKKGNLTKAKENIEYFLRIRNESGTKIPLTMHVITYERYVKTIQANMNVSPSRATETPPSNFENEFEKIKELWSPCLDPTMDLLQEIKQCFGWAERGQWQNRKIDYRQYTCPLLERIKHEAFIAPDGTWYLCCFDAKNEIKIGNVGTESLSSLMDQPKRKNLISLVENRQFEKVGGPCQTVNCCELLYENPKETRFWRYYQRAPSAMKLAMRLGKRLLNF